MAGTAFVSYSHADSDYARRLVDFLRRQGVPVWVDEEIDYGHRWQTVIRQQIDSCAAFLPVMTPSSEDSPWVAREVMRAQARLRPTLPLLLAGDVFFQLADLQFEDVRSGGMPTSAYVGRLQRLTGASDIRPISISPAQVDSNLGTQRAIKALYPVSYNESRKVGEFFRNGHPVLLNLTEMDEGEAKRMVDFSAGLAFCGYGAIERLTNRTFLLSPRDVLLNAETKERLANGNYFGTSDGSVTG